MPLMEQGACEAVDALTRQQLAGLRLHPHRPLLICDVDEVVVRFIDALAGWLQRRNLRLHSDSWALEGNIRDAHGVPVPRAQVGALLDAFFRQCTADLPLMEGAADALAQLVREGVQVVLLTNMPHPFRRARQRNLARHGLNFPVITNSGPKGPAVRHLRQMVRQPAAFIDDHPDFLHSAADHCLPSAALHLLHFVPDNPFVPHLPPMQAPHVSVRNWGEAAEVLHRLLVLPALKRHAGASARAAAP